MDHPVSCVGLGLNFYVCGGFFGSLRYSSSVVHTYLLFMPPTARNSRLRVGLGFKIVDRVI